MDKRDVNKVQQQEQSSVGAQVIGLWSGGFVIRGKTWDGFPELVIQVLDTDKTQLKTDLKPKGFQIKPTTFTAAGKENLGILLTIDDSKFEEIFGHLCEFVLDAILGNFALTGDASEIYRQISKWVDFTAQKRSLSQREKIQGLAGELLAMTEVLNYPNHDFRVWVGPFGFPQDFRGTEDWVEVKTSSARKGPLVHRISSLDQMVTPKDGRLFVVSFRLVLSQFGSRSIHDLVEVARGMEMFSHPGGAGYFDAALHEVGYSADIDAPVSRFDLFGTDVFEVREGFPRILRTDMPSDPRIFDLSYGIDFTAADEFKVSLGNSKLKLN